MFATAALAILITMALVLARAVAGPSLFDRILAVNLVGTKTTLLIAVLGFLSGRPDFLDIALVYGLINFVSVVALLRLFRRSHRLEKPYGRVAKDSGNNQ